MSDNDDDDEDDDDDDAPSEPSFTISATGMACGENDRLVIHWKLNAPFCAAPQEFPLARSLFKSKVSF